MTSTSSAINTVTSRDVQEIVSKLSSDKAKAREEGIKLLNTWLEGERSVGFCRYLSGKTALLKPNDIPHSETWPFIIRLLIQCISLEISSSKRRPPRLSFAKTLRIVVQRTEDVKRSGKSLPLQPIAKLLFSHIWDVLRDTPSWQSEYGNILRHLLLLRHYQFHMRKRVYCSLLLFYMEKVETSLNNKVIGQLNPREDVFRCILTLHSLLDNPPGDFPDGLRGEIVKGFVGIFSHVRDEGKLSRKLIECVNTYLLKDGPNLDSEALEIHGAVHQFVFRCWTTTHDRGLKDSLTLYAKLQLNLTRGDSDGSALLEELLDIVVKELDQMSILTSNIPWSEATRDDKGGTLTSSNSGLVELAALIFCRACASRSKPTSAAKRGKMEPVTAQIKEGLIKGKWLWHAVLCRLIRKYHTRTKKELFTYWLESISTNFERIINNANIEHAYDGLLWTLRTLQGLSSLVLLPAPSTGFLLSSPLDPLQLARCWHMIWSCLIRGLPMLSNVNSIVDEAVMLLNNIILSDTTNTFRISQEIWDTLLFKQSPSVSVLCFISCYFSRRASQGDPREVLYLRQNILRAVLALLNWKECVVLNERLIVMLPAAAYALSAGCNPLPPECGDVLFPSACVAVEENLVMADEREHEELHEFSECSIDVLARIGHESGTQISQSEHCRNIRLPQQIRNQLCHEVEDHILERIKDIEIREMPLSEVVFLCGLLSNIMYCSYVTRQRDDTLSFLSKLGDYMIQLLDHAISVIEKCCNTISNCSGSNSTFNSMDRVIASFRSLLCSPLYSKLRDKDDYHVRNYTLIIQSFEKMLKALAVIYDGGSDSGRDLLPEVDPLNLSDPITVQDTYPVIGSKSMIVDIDLDVDDGAIDVDTSTVGEKIAIANSVAVNWKLNLVTLISSFFPVLPSLTWDTLFSFMKLENDPRVLESLLVKLCQHPFWSSSSKFSDMVMSINEAADLRADLKLHSLDILAAVCCLLQSLLPLNDIDKDNNVACSSRERISEQDMISLGDLVEKVSDSNLFNWWGRVKLIDCICTLVRLKPEIAQSMIEKLLVMLRDPDYRVRLCLARKVGILFQTWDGHHELFQDVCSNFGANLVVYSKQKLVTAKEVLAADPQPRPTLETIIITLMHLALHSDRIELEAVFMTCVIAAIDPSQRDLVCVVLDNLARELKYTTRFKYMEELLGSIVFCWVACGVSLVALVETRDLFVSNAEPTAFFLYCCHWLLGALILHGDTSNLNWVAKVVSRPPADLVKDHFVHIFSVCMALYCSKQVGWEKGSVALGSSFLSIAGLSEDERDKLIKKHMVSIVNHIISLASSSPDPPLPFFSKNSIKNAIQTVVDGFLEVEDQSKSFVLVDKIHIFRPDRVFMFIVEIHYKITAAAHCRHKCDRLACIEVLIDVLGHRAAISSTLNYLLNLVGQHIHCHALLDQCCGITSSLLNVVKKNPSCETSEALGEHLQFLVSRLITHVIPSKCNVKSSQAASFQLPSLLNQIVLDSNPSLHQYLKELEPFPEFGLFEGIQKFYKELCQDYSPREHLLKFVKRSCYLPPRLFLTSLKALHKKLSLGVNYKGSKSVGHAFEDLDWHSDREISCAVWDLVHMCCLDDMSSCSALVSDFISRVGIEDPYRVVFRHSGEANHVHASGTAKAVSERDHNFHMDRGISEQLLIALIRILRKSLVDESVKIIGLASQSLRGILATERGQRALLSFDSYQRSLIEIHSKGVDAELVQKILLEQERKFDGEAISLENSSIWITHGKTFESWICTLVYALIGYCDDIIIRLCQDIALVKSEVAELLYPSVIVNIASRIDLDIDLCNLISSKVQEYIFVESNMLTKSIRVMLDALNELRLCHVMERTTCSTSHKRGSSKYSKSSSYGSKSRSAVMKTKDQSSTSPGLVTSAKLWEKVYWLSIDYLIVAKSAINCGSYFTAVLYVELWCEEHFNSLTLGNPDFSHIETLPRHIEILISAVTQINEPDSLYGIIQSNKLTSQIITFEHEGNWNKALEYYDLQVMSEPLLQLGGSSQNISTESSQQAAHGSFSNKDDKMIQEKPYKGLIRSLQQIGCSCVLNVFCQGLTSQKGQVHHDREFTELQYEAAWRAGNWDFSAPSGTFITHPNQQLNWNHFNENLHSCLRALQEGDKNIFYTNLEDSKQDLFLCLCHASEESTEYIYSSIAKLQIFYHLGMAWNLRWASFGGEMESSMLQSPSAGPVVPSIDQLSRLNTDWTCILRRGQLHVNLLEPLIAFRRVLLQILNCSKCTMQHLLDAASTLRKGLRFSQAAAALHQFKFLCSITREEYTSFYWLGRLEEAKLLHAQGQHEMAINLAKYISQSYKSSEDASDVFRLIGKWMAETRSCNSRIILDKYLKHGVILAEGQHATDRKSANKQSQMHFHLAHYADALFRSHEERLNSSEWHAAMRLRKHKTKELEALIKRLKSSSKGDKIDYSVKIQELQKQLTMDREEAEKLQADRDNFLRTALEGYKRCLVIGDKYDDRVVFRLVSLWFNLSTRKIVVDSMLSTIEEVQSYKFIPLVYQIASRMGSAKDGQGPQSFQFAVVSLVKKMAVDHPYHTVFQLLALSNGDRIKDKQRSRSSFVVDMDKKVAAENLLKELTVYHKDVIRQMKQMVEIYIKLAEMETKREDTNKKVTLPRDIRSVRELVLVPVITSNVSIDRSCQYPEGSFPHFRGLADTVTVMNGINAPKVVECLGSDGNRYRQLAKSGNDDLRQDAVMEQFFGLVNTFLQNHRDTWKRRLRIRTYKVVPFTPSAGVLEWVNGTVPLGEYLIGSSRDGGAHGRYGVGDWTFLKCRQHMAMENDKRKAFEEVCQHFRPVMHYFFLERFLHPADWFEKRLAYTRSLAASSMVGYIVGLGDRHSMNILIDQSSAEVVHIDLGVAFEQGLMLKTPERVPFRLTRDTIDGMGASGVEGVFRRCCEETLSVMRANKEPLLTIIEVFIHDPLYKWALSPLKALQRQKETDDDLETSLECSEEEEYQGNKDAARALMRVKQKLDGYEEGEMRSVHGQVQQLIQDAVDPERLCQMFPGWGAWL